jgi:hypothetical protein
MPLFVLLAFFVCRTHDNSFYDVADTPLELTSFVSLRSFSSNKFIMSNPTKAKRKGEEEESAAGKKAKHAVVVSGASSTAAPVAVKLSTATAFRVFLDGALTDADGVRHIPVPDLVNIVATYYGSTFEPVGTMFCFESHLNLRCFCVQVCSVAFPV